MLCLIWGKISPQSSIYTNTDAVPKNIVQIKIVYVIYLFMYVAKKGSLSDSPALTMRHFHMSYPHHIFTGMKALNLKP